MLDLPRTDGWMLRKVPDAAQPPVAPLAADDREVPYERPGRRTRGKLVPLNDTHRVPADFERISPIAPMLIWSLAGHDVAVIRSSAFAGLKARRERIAQAGPPRRT